MANLEDLERLDDEELIDLDDSEELEDDVVDELTEEEETETEEEPEEIVTDPVPPKPVLPGLSTQVVSVGTKLNVDVTVAIDVTGSMQELIDALKRDVTNLRTLVYDKLNENLSRKRPDRRLNKMRVRVVAFRDYNYDWEAAQQPKHGPMLMSDFFDLDDEDDRAALQRFVDQLEATGGVDEPESALEALHYAIRSDWDREEGVVHRHVIMLFTDASGHRLEDPRNAENPHYPTDADMPKSLLELQAEYGDEALISQRGQRLIVFAPRNSYPWNEVEGWNCTVVCDVVPNSGLAGVNSEPMIAALTGSLS